MNIEMRPKLKKKTILKDDRKVFRFIIETFLGNNKNQIKN
jgi:hypothetical protein